MKTWTPETLPTRVCKNGHIGNWIIRKNNSIACRPCMYEAISRHRQAKGVGGTSPRIGQVDKLREHIEKLEKALEVTKQKLELSIELQRQHEELQKIGQKLKELE